MSDILELIDNAIEGNTSVDAMRWTPDPPDPEASGLRTAGEGRVWLSGIDLGPFMAASGIELTPWQEDVVDRIAGLRPGSLTIRFDNRRAVDQAIARLFDAPVWVICPRRRGLRAMHTAYSRRLRARRRRR